MKHLKLVLRTLISNNACVEAARTKEKKYTIIAIAFVLFALFFSALPTCVTGFQKQASAWLSNTLFNIDRGLQEFGKDAAAKNVTINIDNSTHTINSNNTFKNTYKATFYNYDVDGNRKTDYQTFNEINCYQYSMPIDNKQKDILEVYCYDDKSGKEFQDYVGNLLDNLVPTCPNNNDDKNKPENWLRKQDYKEGDVTKQKKASRNTSIIVFGKDCYYGYIFSPASTTPTSSVYGDYHHMEKYDGKNLINVLTASNNDLKQTIENWKEFSNLGYIDTRAEQTWRSTGIILGVNAGVSLFMGLMVWLLTRGKNNPFRIYTLWDSQKIAYYACLTPGILSLLGFAISNLQMMIYILGVGVRVMWLSMRTLRYQAPGK